MTRRRVLVFGVFDCLHAGHMSFLRQARKYGDELIVAVARDRVVMRLKKKKPFQSETMRIRALRVSGLADRVVLGDSRLGTYAILQQYMPDILCFGYDQSALIEDLRARMRGGRFPTIPCVRLRPHRKKILHSSLLQKSR